MQPLPRRPLLRQARAVAVEVVEPQAALVVVLAVAVAAEPLELEHPEVAAAVRHPRLALQVEGEVAPVARKLPEVEVVRLLKAAPVADAVVVRQQRQLLRANSLKVCLLFRAVTIRWRSSSKTTLSWSRPRRMASET